MADDKSSAALNEIEEYLKTIPEKFRAETRKVLKSLRRQHEEIRFILWAFGPGPSITSLDRMKAWNERHGKKSGLMLEEEGNMMEDLAVIRIIWEFYKDKGIYPCQKD